MTLKHEKRVNGLMVMHKNNMNDQEVKQLKQEIKELIRSIKKYDNNTRIINAVTKYIIADRAKRGDDKK